MDPMGCLTLPHCDHRSVGIATPKHHKTFIYTRGDCLSGSFFPYWIDTTSCKFGNECYPPQES